MADDLLADGLLANGLPAINLPSTAQIDPSPSPEWPEVGIQPENVTEHMIQIKT